MSGREPMKAHYVLAIALSLTTGAPCVANDSSAELATGGLMFTKSSDIEKRSARETRWASLRLFCFARGLQRRWSRSLVMMRQVYTPVSIAAWFAPVLRC